MAIFWEKSNYCTLTHLWEHHWHQILPPIPSPSGAAITYSWAKDPWSLGGWAYPTQEQEKALFQELDKPEGRIYFAGEYTSVSRR